MNRAQRRSVTKRAKVKGGRVTPKAPRATVTFLDEDGHVIGKKEVAAQPVEVKAPDPEQERAQEVQRRRVSAASHGLWLPPSYGMG